MPIDWNARMVSEGYLAYHPNPKKPDIQLPPGACDSHCHVFGPGDLFPYAPTSSYIPVDASAETLRARHDHLGIEKAVLVQASCHGTDNSAMLDALDKFPDQYRGVAIVAPDISNAALETMHEAGVRGVRFNFVKRLRARQSETDRQRIIEKISRLGWHVVVYFEPEDLPDIAAFLRDAPLPIIIDHMGRVPVEKGVQSAEFARLAALIEDEKYWIKVSCPERLSRQGPPYADVDDVARRLLELAPHRTLWGTDFPHPNMKSHMPDDGLLVDRLAAICPTNEALRQLLIDNPNRLYWSD